MTTDHKKPKQTETTETRIFDMIVNTCFFAVQILWETLHGIFTRRFPWLNVAFVVGLIYLGLRYELERKLMHLTPFARLHPLDLWPASYNVWFWFWMSCPFWVWGIISKVSKRKTKERHEAIFTSAGLKNRAGKTPTLRREFDKDDGTFSMVFKNAGFSLEQLRKSLPNLESAFLLYIDDVSVDTTNGNFTLSCSRTAMPDLVHFGQIPLHSLSGECTTIRIGLNRTEKFYCDLRHTPHLLVAGETSSGKSTFIRGAVATLYQRNETMQFSVIDLKAGLESTMYEGVKRFKIADDLSSAENHLKTLDEELTRRFKKLKEYGYASINEIEDDIELKIPRRLIVIDEVTELFYGSRARGSSTAREIINKIARQGRAAGFHLIIGTQRPDARSLDTQIKANLGGKLCFKMADTTSSVIVLGNAKAKSLPAIAGRGIWQSGMESVEVQTPFLSTSSAKETLTKSQAAN